MYILVSGVRHRTAPIDVREKFALLEQEVPAALKILRACAGIEECAILTTCNRTELYLAVTDTEAGLQAVKQFYKLFKGLDLEPYRQYRFNLLHEDAVTHLFRVASGLDSLIVGEGQIMGQVKGALAVAQEEKTAGLLLDKLFKSALSVGKRVRTETGIAEKDVSVSLAAFHFAKREVPDLMDRRITLIGGGKMAEIVMSLFKQGMTPTQQANVVLVNRSHQRLSELSTRYGFKGLDWDRLNEGVAHAEVLFVATGAPHVVLGQDDFTGTGEQLVIDIAVPRNVDPRVAELPGVRLINTDDLAGLNTFSDEAQAQLKQQAQAILEEECENFRQWRIARSVVPTIARLHEKVESIRRAELAAAASEQDFAAMDAISRNLIRKILHDPTVQLKRSANLAEISRHVSALCHLFGLDPAEVAPPSSSDEAAASDESASA